MQEMIEAKVIHLIIKEPRNEAKAVIPIFHASVFLELLESAIHRDFRESSRVLCSAYEMHASHTYTYACTHIQFVCEHFGPFSVSSVAAALVTSDLNAALCSLREDYVCT